MQGDFLFSPSLFFDFADGDAPPVDNLSVFIGFSFLWFCESRATPAARKIGLSSVAAERAKEETKKAAWPKPNGKRKSPSGAKPEGPKLNVKTKKSPRRKAGDFLMCYVNYPVCASVFDECQKLAAIRMPP